MSNRFEVVGIRPLPEQPVQKEKWYRGKPLFSAALLALIVLGCLGCRLLITVDPTYMDLSRCSVPPSRQFLFGTDTMGDRKSVV